MLKNRKYRIDYENIPTLTEKDKQDIRNSSFEVDHRKTRPYQKRDIQDYIKEKLSFLFGVQKAYATTLTKTIGTDTRDYSTITLWEADLDSGTGAAVDATAYAAGDEALGEMYNDSVFDETVSIDGGATIGLTGVTLSVVSTDRHDGTAGNGARIVHAADTSASTIKLNISDPTVVAEWIEVDYNGKKGGIAFEQARLTNTLHLTIVRNSIAHGIVGNDVDHFAFSGANDRASTWLNNIGYDWSASENTGSEYAMFGAKDDKSYFLNNTALGPDRTDSAAAGESNSFLGGTLSRIRNSIGMDATHTGGLSPDDFSPTAGGLNIDHNFSSDTTASGTGSIKSGSSALVFVSTTSGSEDLHLVSTASGIDVAFDLGLTPTNIEIDIDGETRASGAATEGPNSPGTTVDDSTVGTVTWSNVNNSQAQDDNPADASLGDGFGGASTSHYIKATNFSFAIPTGARIVGIVVEVDKHEGDAGDDVVDNAIRIVKGGTIGSKDQSDATEWQVGDDDTYFSYGSSTELWGETWTESDIENSGFGFAISATGNGGLSIPGNTQIDHIRITVHYETTPWDMGADEFVASVADPVPVQEGGGWARFQMWLFGH